MRLVIRSRSAIAVLIAAALCVTAAATASAAEQTKPEEFVVSFNSLNLELDPHHSIYSAEAQIFTATYEGLFTYNPSSLEPVKASCKSYTRSPDGRTYTFYIRDEANWSDGSPLTAKDFSDAWLRALAPSTKADYAAFFDVIAGAKDFRLGRNADPATVGITVIADKILQVKLESKTDYFTRLLCHHSFSPIHPSMLHATDWKKAIPFPVNGPYRFQSLDADGAVLVKNERYWDSASVAIPRLRIVFSDDDSDVTRRFDNGEIHWLAGAMDLKALQDKPALQVNPMFGTHYWFFNCKDKPWNDGDLRRALALLLPWKDIRSRDSYLIPADTLVLPFEGYQDAKGIIGTDSAEAKKLLAQAGHAEGAGLPAIVILCPDGDDAKRVAGLMQTAWQAAGLKVDLKLVPAAHYFESVRNGPGKAPFTLALTTWIGDFADPLAFLQMWSSDSNLNDAGLADAEYDAILAASASKEGTDRLASLAKAETRLLAGAAVLPIYHSVAVNVVDNSFIQGWYANALDIHPFKYFAFGEKKIRPNVAGGPGILDIGPAGSAISLASF
jgi:peptide/nickel transport system substrate-binding protein/oligopeptide transport system substrate-binding protein